MTDELRFIHDSLRDYFCAEALGGLCDEGLCLEAPPEPREAALDKLDCLVKEEKAYRKWGPIMCRLPALIGDRTVPGLIGWCRNWSENRFGLDCLASLYHRRYFKLVADRPFQADEAAEALFALVEDEEFRDLKATESLLRHSPLDDVRLALEVALDRFCPGSGLPTNLRFLPRLVHLGLLQFGAWAYMSMPAGGVVETSSTGQYPQAFRNAHLLGRHDQTSYSLLLLIAWVAAEKAREGRESQDLARAQYHCQIAEQAVGEALWIAPNDCFIDGWWEKLILAIARSLSEVGWVNQAIEIIERFGKEVSPSRTQLGVPAPELDDRERRHHASHYLVQLASSTALERDVRLRLLDRARGRADAPGSPHHDWAEDFFQYWEEEKYGDRVTIAGLYVDLGLPEQAGEIYQGLLEEWIGDWGSLTGMAEQTGEPNTGHQQERTEETKEGDEFGGLKPISLLSLGDERVWRRRERISALDLLLNGLKAFSGAPWVADWCRNLRAGVEPLPSPELQLAIWARLARAYVIAGDLEEAESLLTRTIEILERGLAPVTMIPDVVLWISPLSSEVSERWRTRYLPQLIRVFHEVIVHILDEIESGRACRKTGEKEGLEVTREAETGLEHLITSECMFIRELARLNDRDIEEARQRVAESIRAIRSRRAGKLKPLILLKTGLLLQEIGETGLSRDAMSQEISPRIKELTLEDFKRCESMNPWSLPGMRHRCPAFWETYAEARDAVDHFIGERYEKDRQDAENFIDLKVERLLDTDQPLEAAKLFEGGVAYRESEELHEEYERYAGEWWVALVAGLQEQYPDVALGAIRALRTGDSSPPEGFRFPMPKESSWEGTLSSLIGILRQRRRPVPDPVVEELTSMVRETEPLRRDLLLALARICLRQGMRSRSARLIDLALEGIEEGFSDPELLELIDDAQELAPDLAWKVLEKAALFPSLGSFSVGVAGRLYRWGRTDEGLALFRYIIEGKRECPESRKKRTAVYRPLGWEAVIEEEESRLMTIRAMVAEELWRIGQEAWAEEMIVPLRCELERFWEKVQGLDLDDNPDAGDKVKELRSLLLAASKALAAMGDQEAAGELRRRAGKLKEQKLRFLEKVRLPGGGESLTLWELVEKGPETAEWYCQQVDDLQDGDSCEADRLWEAIRDKQGPEWVPVRLKLLRVRLADPEERRRQLAGLLRSPGADELTAVDAILAELIRLCEDPQILLEIFKLMKG